MRTLTLRLPAAVLLLAAGLALSTCGCNSTSGWSRNQLGKRSYNTGDYTAARRSFEQALMNDPWNPNYAFNVAAAMQKQGDQLAAERMYQHALTLNPSHQPSYHALAGLLQQEGRSDEAQELLSAWVETQPYSPESHIEMAWMQQERGDYQSAEASLQQALRRNPRNTAAMARLGQLYEVSGRRAEAAALYNRSLAYNRMQPQVSAQLNGMGMPGYFSPSLMMAQQMPQSDPTLTAFSWSSQPQYGQPQYGQQQYGQMQYGQPQFAQAQYPQPPAYGSGAPYTAFMTPGMGATMSPMAQPTAAQFGAQQAFSPGDGWQLVSTQMVPGPAYSSGMPSTGVTMSPLGNAAAPSGVVPASATMPYAAPTTVTTAPYYTSGVPDAVPTYAPPQVQLGTPSPISQSPAAAVPAISAVVPVVPAF